MNTISDINKNIEPLSGLNLESEESSLISSLFTISLNSEEIISQNDLIDKEFVFEEDDIKFIEYISNIVPDFENKKNNLLNLGEIETTIKSDTNLNETDKNKILNFIKLGLTSLKEIKLEIASNIKFKLCSTEKSLKPSNNSIENMKLLNDKKNKINSNNFKNINNINYEKINNNDEEKIGNDLQIQQANKEKKISINNQQSAFVKKIKRNDHPNKIYDFGKVSTIEQNKFDNVSSQFQSKLINNTLISQLSSHISEIRKKNNINEPKTNNHQNIGFQQSNQTSYPSNNYSNNGNASFSNNGYNSVLENFLDNLDLTQKGWTSKLVSRIEGSLIEGGGEIEFNLKPKNLGMLKVSVTLREGIGSVKIITENSFVTTALNQNENYLQKLFNDQGINLEFSAKNENQNPGSQNDFNQNANNKKEKKQSITDKNVEVIDENDTDEKSSRHIINVIA
jgi:flagellar hook-length control protein FliK